MTVRVMLHLPGISMMYCCFSSFAVIIYKRNYYLMCFGTGAVIAKLESGAMKGLEKDAEADAKAAEKEAEELEEKVTGGCCGCC